MSTTDILFNSPALHSLKRDQLVKLCKVHSLKASGKNVELIERLKQHARTLPKDSPLSVASRSEEPTTVDDDYTDRDQSTDDGGTHQARECQVPRPCGVAMESIPEMIEESSSQGTVSSLRTLDNGSSGEFGTRGSKSSIMSSSIKALASSLGLKRANSSLAASSSTRSVSSVPSTSTPEELAQHPLPCSLFSQANAVSPNGLVISDPPMQSETARPTPDSIPLPGHSLRPGVPVPPNARLSLGLDVGAPSTASKEQEPTTTIRLISHPFKPPSYASNDPSIGRTPQLKPFKTSFDLVMGSPTSTVSGSGYPGINLWPPEDPNDDGESLYPKLSLESHSATHDFMDTDADVPIPGSLSFPTPQTPTAPTKVVEPFIFGSPLPQHKVSNAQFKTAAASVLDEMNKRLQVDGVQGVPMDMISKLQSGAHADGVKPLLNRGVHLMPKASDMTKKFEKMHEEEFKKMEGIDGFSKRRGMLPKSSGDETKRLAIVAKRKSNVVGHGAGRDRFGRRIGGETPGRLTGRIIVPKKKSRVLPGSFEEEDDGGEHGEDEKMEERKVSVEPSDGGDKNLEEGEVEKEEEERKRKEQQAIKRKLELNKAKRRSSAGVAGARGRVSVGRGGVLLKPQPKPSRFGFLSSAKSLVQNVFGRGKTAAPAAAASSNVPKVVPSKVKKSVKVPPVSTSRPMTAKLSGEGASSLRTAPGARSPIPPPGPPPSSSTRSSLMSAAGTRTNQNNLNTGTNALKGSNVGGVSSVGTRSSFASTSKLSGTATGIGASSMGSKKVLSDAAERSSTTGSTSLTRPPSRLPSSRLLAPTASSLAKITRSPAKYAAGNIAVSRIKTEAGLGLLGMITNSPTITKGPFSPRAGGIFSKPLVPPTGIPTIGRKQEIVPPVAGNSKLNSNPTSNVGEIKDANSLESNNSGSTRQRSLLVRKPHISRSKVIAKLASQRAATASGSSGAKVGGTPSQGGRIRSSLGAKVQRASYGGKTSGGGRIRGGGGDVMMSAKKRVRQSEYARRRSRVEPINFGGEQGDGNGMHVDPE